MHKYFTLILLVLSTIFLSSCFFRHHGPAQYRQRPPQRISTTSYNILGIRTRSRGRNYKNQYRSDYRGHRGGRDPYHYRQNRFKY